MKNLVLILVFIAVAFSGNAQSMQITGIVSDSGGPLPGANIVVQGTTNGTQTDFDGNFSVDMEKGQTLVFSYLGFETKSQKIKNDEQLMILMQEEEMVCFTSIDHILPYKIYELYDSDENWQTTEDLRISLLKIPGVQVGSSRAFSSSSIRMRGENNTIVIVDGVRYDSSILNSLNPSDIENIKVATDAAASNYLRNSQ